MYETSNNYYVLQNMQDFGLLAWCTLFTSAKQSTLQHAYCFYHTCSYVQVHTTQFFQHTCTLTVTTCTHIRKCAHIQIFIVKVRVELHVFISIMKIVNEIVHVSNVICMIYRKLGTITRYTYISYNSTQYNLHRLQYIYILYTKPMQ